MSEDGSFGSSWTEAGFAAEISAALRQELGNTRTAVKTLVEWTGANERTVKNWLAGRYGPSGAHMVALMRRSDIVFRRILDMADRRIICESTGLAEAEQHLLAILTIVRGLSGERVQSE